MRQESTLNERYVIADLSDSIDDRAYQRLLENMRAYLNEFYRGIFEKRGTQWDFQIQPESESNNIPTIKNLPMRRNNIRKRKCLNHDRIGL